MDQYEEFKKHYIAAKVECLKAHDSRPYPNGIYGIVPPHNNIICLGMVGRLK